MRKYSFYPCSLQGREGRKTKRRCNYAHSKRFLRSRLHLLRKSRRRSRRRHDRTLCGHRAVRPQNDLRPAGTYPRHRRGRGGAAHLQGARQEAVRAFQLSDGGLRRRAETVRLLQTV